MTDSNRYYITTAIDYPNSRPHIGTAFEKIGADVQARFRRMEGRDVHFQMGNDENTIKVEQAAEKKGLDTKAYVDDMARQFLEVWRALDISNDGFIQTSDPLHHAGCRKFIQAVYDAGDIEKRSYTGLYCTGCEAFKTEKEVTEAGGKCPNHPQLELNTVEEENYFFLLSRYGDRLLELYEKEPGFIQPESRRNEILNLVKSGLQDVSITRKGFTWGIPVPFDDTQTIYVWFDALLNYITAIGYGWDDARFRERWPADVHVIGKDITRFHCALWPAMLMSAGLPVPRSVFAHGFVYRKNEESGVAEKMSKSLGNVVEPMDLITRFESVTPYASDAFRYYFMSQCPFGGDGEFSFERFVESYNTGLANNLGNLYSRTLTMCHKYFGGRLEGSSAIDPTAWRAGLDWPALVGDLRSLVGSFQYNVALSRLWLEVLDSANKYIDTTQPFKLAKTDPEACKAVLVNLAEALRVASILARPFLPKSTAAIYESFNFGESEGWESVGYESALGRPLGPDLRLTSELPGGKPSPLFPKVETRAD